MNNINTFVGTLQEDSFEWRDNGGEMFYFTHIDMEGYVIPAVMSHYFFDTLKGKRVSVSAFPRETRIKINGERQVFSYLYCIHVEEADPECEDCRYVEIEGVVLSRNNKLVLSQGNDSKMYFRMEYGVDFGYPVRVLVPCRAFGAAARALIGVHKGDRMRVSGKISGAGQSLKLVIKEFNMDEESEPTVEAEAAQ